MFNPLKKFFSKTFVSPKKETLPVLEPNQKLQTTKENETQEQISSFEPSYIEPSLEPVIKKTQRNLKYRR